MFQTTKQIFNEKLKSIIFFVSQTKYYTMI